MVTIHNKKFKFVEKDEGLLFDEDFRLLTEIENSVDYYTFCFGGNWYYSQYVDKVDLKLLKNFGYSNESESRETFLGVRGGYELLNGSGIYSDWINRAKFLQVSSLGICERNTLGGVLKFQIECKKSDIKPIIGATYTVFREQEDYRYDIKCYVKNEAGWRSILLINKEVNVDNLGYVTEKRLLELQEGLIFVIDPKSLDFEKIFPLDMSLDLLYQLDPVEYSNYERDSWYIKNLNKYLKGEIEPVSITDAFYINKEDSHIKAKLNTIGGFQEYKAKNQYFKGTISYFKELSSLFHKEDEGKAVDLALKAIENERVLADKCGFSVDTSQRNLPKFKMSDELKKKHKDVDSLFYSLIEEGFGRKTPKGKEDEYLKRISDEIEVIQLVNGVNGANGFDYFLILWDIVRYCKEQNILVGHGRGSAAGSLIAYLLDITQVDPIEWGLFFERFLNPGRATKSLPDIDIDVQPSRKEEVKMYISKKYGFDQFCYIGTYTTLQLKAALKDLSKIDGANFEDVNFVSQRVDFKGNKGVLTDIFETATRKPDVKKFVNKFSQAINDIDLVLGQPRSKSIHACATLIFPEEKPIYEWIPVRLAKNGNDEDILVSEWEGNELEKAGFLKEDILVIDQLDKYSSIIESVKERYDKDIDIYKIPDNDANVISYFKQGFCADIFQFGTQSFINYLMQLKPDDIHELIDAVALLRPGAMEVNSHNEYVLRKFGKRDITYKYGTEEITKNTKGLIITQEQVMKLCQSLGGFTLAEADDVRKAIGKKIADLMALQREKFIAGARNSGASTEEILDIWHDIEVHGSYSFNLSHSVSYTKVSVVGMFLKVYYPLAFWLAAFKHDEKGTNTSKYISEINRTGKIDIIPVDINVSEKKTKADFNNNSIYWSLSDIKMVGDVAANQIIEEREANGQYFSLEEFYERHNFTGSKVNKRVVENLIFSGAFDALENIKLPSRRINLINQFRELKSLKIDDSDILVENQDKLSLNWWWTLQQKKLSGIAFFDYEKIFQNYFNGDKLKMPYLDYIEFSEDKGDKHRQSCTIAGYVTDVVVKNSSKGEFARITIENNYDFYDVVVWAEQYEHFEDIINSGIKKTLCIVSGEGVYDNYNKKNILQTNGDSTLIILE